MPGGFGPGFSKFHLEGEAAFALRKIGKSTVKNPVFLHFYVDFSRGERREARQAKRQGFAFVYLEF